MIRNDLPDLLYNTIKSLGGEASMMIYFVNSGSVMRAN